jgi:hypothetical protein
VSEKNRVFVQERFESAEGIRLGDVGKGFSTKTLAYSSGTCEKPLAGGEESRRSQQTIGVELQCGHPGAEQGFGVQARGGLSASDGSGCLIADVIIGQVVMSRGHECPTSERPTQGQRRTDE